MTSTSRPTCFDDDKVDPATELAYNDLVSLTEQGVRFHGSPGIARAADWLESKLGSSGLTAERQSVAVPGWQPGDVCRLAIIEPQARELVTWPLLWSGASQGTQRGRLVEQGREGLWGDSMVWRRFIVIGDDGEVLAYVLGRDTDPAAPQPLPSGSDYSAPHFAVGRADSDQLSDLVGSGGVTVEFELDSRHEGVAISDNLIVNIAGKNQSPNSSVVLLCAHYDTFWNTPGAYDNGSGTIALLQLAQRWAMSPPPHPVRLVFFTGEEWHLSGSREYVRAASHRQLDGTSYALNIDGLGRGSYIEAFAAPERFEITFSHAIRAYIESTRAGLPVVSRFPPPTGTDDAVFYKAGVPSGFLTFNDLERLHQPDDLPNLEIARNIAWTVGLMLHLVETLSAPDRSPAPDIL
jgi:hypothetical protein